MLEKETSPHLKVYKDKDALTSIESQLMDKAIEALDLSYAPYSNFNVGAALITTNGSISKGANQENASYPLCICGERVALFNSSINHPNETVTTLAIVAHSGIKPVMKPVTPCGACRQVISEYEQRQNTPIKIILKGDSDEIYVFESGKALLPFSFDNTYLLG